MAEVTCTTGKVRYPDSEQAAWALEDIRAQGSAWEREKIPIRVYECPVCRGWHLTSQEHRR